MTIIIIIINNITHVCWQCRSALVGCSSPFVCLHGALLKNERSQSVQSWYRERSWDILEMDRYGLGAKGQGRMVSVW